MRDYYFVEPHSGVFWIHLKTIEGLPFFCPRGSYNVLKARILNLTYGDFLSFSLQNGATLKGRDGGYIVEFFQKQQDAEKMCALLNKNFNKILEYIESEKEEKND